MTAIGTPNVPEIDDGALVIAPGDRGALAAYEAETAALEDAAEKWRRAADAEPVTITAGELRELRQDAASWRRWWEPEWIACRQRCEDELVGREVERRLRDLTEDELAEGEVRRRLRGLSEDALAVQAGLWTSADEAHFRRSIKGWSASVSQIAAWRSQAYGHTDIGAIERARRMTSTLPCGQCGVDVEVEHPLPREHWDRLPDTSWVRCAGHGAVAA